MLWLNIMASLSNLDLFIPFYFPEYELLALDTNGVHCHRDPPPPPHHLSHTVQVSMIQIETRPHYSWKRCLEIENNLPVFAFTLVQKWLSKGSKWKGQSKKNRVFICTKDWKHSFINLENGIMSYNCIKVSNDDNHSVKNLFQVWQNKQTKNVKGHLQFYKGKATLYIHYLKQWFNMLSKNLAHN